MLDPFSSLSAAAAVFSHSVVNLSPLLYTTPQFGGAWGSPPHTAPLSASAIIDLVALMDQLATAGMATIEAATTTCCWVVLVVFEEEPAQQLGLIGHQHTSRTTMVLHKTPQRRCIVVVVYLLLL